MKIIRTVFSQEMIENNDFRNFLKIDAQNNDGDGIELSFLDGESEDANISRDFYAVNNIVAAMKLAFDAGKNGEQLILEDKERTEWE